MLETRNEAQMPDGADVRPRELGGRQAVLFRTLQGWSGSDLGADVAAGLTLAAIAIPEQMRNRRTLAAGRSARRRDRSSRGAVWRHPPGKHPTSRLGWDPVLRRASPPALADLHQYVPSG